MVISNQLLLTKKGVTDVILKLEHLRRSLRKAVNLSQYYVAVVLVSKMIYNLIILVRRQL